jgi:hypothetical protein
MLLGSVKLPVGVPRVLVSVGQFCTASVGLLRLCRHVTANWHSQLFAVQSYLVS